MTYPQPRDFEPPSDFEPPNSFGSGLDIRELLRRFWAYKWLLAFVFVIGVGSTWVVVQQMVPRYTATATLLIKPPETKFIELKDVVEGLDASPQSLRTEVIVLRSRELAKKVVANLGLYDSPRFNSTRLAEGNLSSPISIPWNTSQRNGRTRSASFGEILRHQ